MEIKDFYDPENYYRHYVKKCEVDLKGHSLSSFEIDDILFSIETLALINGHKSYIKDVNTRLVKYLDEGIPLPPSMKNYLSTQLKCLAGGMEPNKVFYMKGKKGKGKASKLLRNKMIYDFLKCLTETNEYSLEGNNKKGSDKIESAFIKAGEFFHASRSTIKKAYEAESKKQTVKKLISTGFEEYKANGGALSRQECFIEVMRPKKQPQ